MLGFVLIFLNIGTQELVLILFVALLLFGGEKLPGLARGLGKGIRDFKDASEGVKREINNQINNYEEKKPATPAELPAASEAESAPEPVETEKAPLIDTTPVAGTTPIGESYINENHGTDTHVDTTTEPVKTAHNE